MTGSDNITFYQSKKMGRGLPFVIVEHKDLVSSNDIFTPSLRDFHVIFWLKKGTVTYHIDFQKHTLHANTIVLVSKDSLHYFDHFEKECELQSIVFEPNFIYKNDSDAKHLFNFNASCHFQGIQILELNKEAEKFLKNTSDQMFLVLNEWTGKEQFEAFYHLLNLFLIKCEQLQQKDHVAKMGRHDKILLTFNSLLEQHFKTESKVEFYVEELGVSVKTLSRIIKEQYRMSTKAYIDERRVLELKRLLKGTTQSVKTIAYDMGFDEPTNMVKYFKKHVGTTPLAFRESIPVQ